jgi:hypothetical protein
MRPLANHEGSFFCGGAFQSVGNSGTLKCDERPPFVTD